MGRAVSKEDPSAVAHFSGRTGVPGVAGGKGGTVNFFCTSVRADASGNSVEVRVADGAGGIPARASTDFDGDFFFIPNQGTGGGREKAGTWAAELQ